ELPMAHSRGLATAILFALVSSPTLARAEADPQGTAADADTEATAAISYSHDATFASRYIFQGFDYSEGQSVLQPDLVLSLVHEHPSLGAWGNARFDRQQFDEIDLTVKLTQTFHALTVSPSFTHLQYPNREGWNPTDEVILDLAWSGPLSPTLSVHDDVGE